MEFQLFPFLKSVVIVTILISLYYITMSLIRKYPKSLWPYAPAVVVFLFWINLSVRTGGVDEVNSTNASYDSLPIEEEPVIELRPVSNYQVKDNKEKIDIILDRN